MVHGEWLVDALKHISELAREEGLEGVTQGLSHVLETYALEMELTEQQQDEIFKTLALDVRERSQTRDRGATSL